uniref:CARMIL pleckstrin homology domain-containing protein n=1 Tax=Piliocolobus tephrosceles TaxID=591936 RepID=A0A8C9GJD0_9PRIM
EGKASVPVLPSLSLYSIRRCLSQGAVLQQHRVKLETKPKKFEDRVLALTSWRLHLFPLKVPAKVESSFNVLEIRAFNTLSQNQILVETERGMVSMRLPSAESVDQVTRHVSSALSKVCPGPGCLIRRGNADTPEGPRDTSPNSETSTSTTHSVCGGFSETYAALCDYNGLHCREEVQWRLGPNGSSPGLQPVVHQTLLQGLATGATYPEQVGEPRRAGAGQRRA